MAVTRGKVGNPNWKKGQSANPSGRRHGSKDKLSKEVFKMIQSGELDTPLKFVLQILTSKDPLVTMKDRQWAAGVALPYCHRKMPIAIEGGESPIRVFDASKLAGLSGEELRSFMGLLTKLGVGDAG